MDLLTISMPVREARERLADYQALDQPTGEDEAIIEGLRALADDKPVIDMRSALIAGGFDEQGQPRLAVAYADWQLCHLIRARGWLQFVARPWPTARQRRLRFDSLDCTENWARLAAIVPPIPPAHRPRAYKLRRYLVMFEVEEWKPAPDPPGDPVLLRPLGGNLAVVEAQWDLTELERAVLSARRPSL